MSLLSGSNHQRLLVSWKSVIPSAIASESTEPGRKLLSDRNLDRSKLAFPGDALRSRHKRAGMSPATGCNKKLCSTVARIPPTNLLCTVNFLRNYAYSWDACLFIPLSMVLHLDQDEGTRNDDLCLPPRLATRLHRESTDMFGLDSTVQWIHRPHKCGQRFFKGWHC